MEPTTMQGPAAAARQLPDLNAETNPFELVASLLDRAAYFNFYAAPSAPPAGPAPPDPEQYFDLDGGFQLRIDQRLHPLESVLQTPSAAAGVRVAQRVGRAVARYRSRWLVTSDEAPWKPGEEPQPVALDPWRSQRFVMADEEIGFDGGPAFRGYGLGRTLPIQVGGRRLLFAQGAGAVLSASGDLDGLAGTYVVDGTLEPGRGFFGMVLCRFIDPHQKVKTASDLPASPSVSVDLPDSLLLLRGQKRDRHQLTDFHFGDGPMPDGIITPAILHSARYRFARRPGGRLASRMSLRQEIGRLRAVIFTNFLVMPGDERHPGKFHTQNRYTFVSPGGEVVGEVEADVELGRTFALQFPDLPDQEGLHFGGVGRIVGGSGCFAGAQGTLTVNSAIGKAPHALSLLNTLRIVDPEGSFRVGG